MHKTASRSSLVALALAAAVAQSACYGNFSLVKGLYGWNGGVTGNKFARSLITWAMILIPIYPIAGFIDFVILNPIEFWSGRNPVATTEGDGSTRLVHDGHEYLHRVDGSGRIEVLRDGVLVARYRMVGEGRAIVEDPATGRELGEVSEARGFVAYAR